MKPASQSLSIIGVPLDLGASRRGVDMGPSALRVTGLARQLAEIGHDVVDTGDVDVPLPEVEARVQPFRAGDALDAELRDAR